MNAREAYRKQLLEAYERRRSRNLTYSIRAFARDLGIPAPKVSQYMKGTSGLSPSRASQIAKKLRFSSEEAARFICATEAVHARSPAVRERAIARLRDLFRSSYAKVNMDKFRLISDWYHVAILELTSLPSFQPDIDWISKQLDLDTALVAEAVKRMQALGLLDCQGTKWLRNEINEETPPDFTSVAIREFHRQMIRLTEGRIEKVPLERRELGSVIFPVDPVLLPELKKMVRDFQRQIASFVEQSGVRDHLYTVNIQLMPLTLGE